MTADIVLDVADMQRLAPCLGPHVEVRAVEGGMHDLVLSKPAVRALVFTQVQAWLKAIGATH
jgi:alpha-beta hydrolase superfamily lysophospholipase